MFHQYSLYKQPITDMRIDKSIEFPMSVLIKFTVIKSNMSSFVALWTQACALYKVNEQNVIKA